MKTITLKDLQENEYRQWLNENCSDYRQYGKCTKDSHECDTCIFCNVACDRKCEMPKCWIKKKEMFGEAFLAQTITILYDGTIDDEEKQLLQQLTDTYLPRYDTIQVARIRDKNNGHFMLRLVCKGDATYDSSEFCNNTFRIAQEATCLFKLDVGQFDSLQLNRDYPLYKLLHGEEN